MIKLQIFSSINPLVKSLEVNKNVSIPNYFLNIIQIRVPIIIPTAEIIKTGTIISISFIILFDFIVFISFFILALS